MTIRFTKSWNGYYEGQIVTNPAGGNTEAQLIALGYAVSDLDGPDNSFELAKFATDPLTGNVTGLVGPGGLQVPVGEVAIPAVSNRVIQRFTSLHNTTITLSNATAVTTIDPASPFGCPALKVVVTFTTAGGRVDVEPAALNIPNWNGNIGFTAWFDDPTRIGQVAVMSGTAGYALYQQANRPIMSGGDLVGGHRVEVGGPIRKNNVTDGGFVFGTNTLQATKLRVTAGASGYVATFWVKDCFIAQPMRPIVSFTFDDGFDNWVTQVMPIMSKHGVKATFSVNSAAIDGGGYISSSNLATLIASGHQVACHNVNNYKLQTLYGSGTGETNGSGTSVDVGGYVSEYYTARAILEARGVAPQDLCFHPWVQGGVDTAGVIALDAAGVDIARGTFPYESQMYGFQLGNNALNLRSINLDGSRTLGQAKVLIDDAIRYGGLAMVMGHEIVTTAPGAVAWLASDLDELVRYAVEQGADVLTARGVRDRFAQLGILQDRNTATAAQPVRVIGRLLNANMNSSSDQTITLHPGQWKIEQVMVTKPSTSLTTAAGGVYTATAKGGTAVVAAGQVYSGLTTTTDVVSATIAATPTISNNTLYLSLTTPQGAAATADVFVFGRPA